MLPKSSRMDVELTATYWTKYDKGDTNRLLSIPLLFSTIFERVHA